VSPLKRVIDAILATVCVVLFALLVIVVSWQVFSRQVLASPSTWTPVAAQYLFVWLALFGSAYVFSERGHIAVDFVARKAGAGGQRVIGVLTLSIVAVFAILVMIWGGIRATEISWTQQVSGIPVTVGQMYLALPISGALIVFYSALHIVKILAGREAGLPIAEDDEIGRTTTAHPRLASAPWQMEGMEVVSPVIPPGTALPHSPGASADSADHPKGR
jgi:TRAP-type C4-dicarboxylate transport system permease small subunit